MGGTDVEAVVVIWSTFPDEASAVVAARALIEDRLAACVVRLAGATSLYRWRGAIEETAEVVLLAKTRAGLADAAMAAIAAAHPYEVPAILVLPVTAVAAPWRAWLEAETATTVASGLDRDAEPQPRTG